MGAITETRPTHELGLHCGVLAPTTILVVLQSCPFPPDTHMEECSQDSNGTL